MATVNEMNNLIIYYFNEAYTQIEILYILFIHHGIIISLRQLQRSLKELKLARKNVNESCIQEIVLAIVEEISDGSGTCLGYKSLWNRLRSVYALQVKRNTVLEILRIADPEGILQRSKKRLKRRKYIVPGPNFLWHIDGYDKLKPFGFAIHGSIDGFSRKIIWLKVGTTNNNPKVIASYYLDSLKNLSIMPTLLRTDLGTENCIMGALQCYLRNDHVDSLAGLRSHIEGKSTSNQRIESYWSQMRRQGINWWISFFKDLRDQGLMLDGDKFNVECVRYCFGRLLQGELDLIAAEWNRHCIRKQKNVELPTGKPELLYNLPELFSSKDYGKKFNQEDLNYLIDNYSTNSTIYDRRFDELVQLLLPDIEQPQSIPDAKALYFKIMEKVEELNNT